MKTSIYTLLFLLIIQVLPAQDSVQDQVAVYKGLVNIKQNKAEVVDGVLQLDMNILLSGLSVGRYHTLKLTPMLRNGNHSLRLSPLRINGANKQKMYERTVAFQGKHVADGDAYLVLKSEPTLLHEINYKQEKSFKPWMKEAELILIGELNDYDGKLIQTHTDVLTDCLHISQKEKAFTD